MSCTSSPARWRRVVSFSGRILGVSMLLILALVALSSASAQESGSSPSPPPPLDLRDGDRVVMLGGTFVERLQVYGYFETLATSAYYDRQIAFRNLGWSGDTVWGESRAVFGDQANGFARLVKDTTEAKPTVILLNYGGNEAYAGPKGIPDFVAGLNKLLDALKPTGARLVLLSPMAREQLPAPLPDPATYNAVVKQYCDAIRGVAQERKLAYVDLYDLIATNLKITDAQGERPVRLTDNGLHLSEVGQAIVSQRLAERLGIARPTWDVSIDLAKEAVTAQGAAVDNLKSAGDSVTFRATAKQLPLPPIFDNRQPFSRDNASPNNKRIRNPELFVRLSIRGLKPGDYELRVDDQPLTTADAERWAEGVRFELTPDVEQAEQLRREIFDKNVFYFHRYRPQNETYLFLFRKHEQGNNAVEIPQFDPLIEEREKKIAELRRPVARKFELRKN